MAITRETGPVTDVLLPRYGAGTLADVVPSLLTALGSAPSPAPPVFPFPPVRAAALLLIDGLGRELLTEYAADAPVLSAMADAGPLTVGFPSTTPISLTSLGTGMVPGAHGTLGLRFRVEGHLLDALGWSEGRSDLREKLAPERVQPEPTLFERGAAAGVEVVSVSPMEFRRSGLTRSGLRGGEYRGIAAPGDLAVEMLSALEGPGPRLVYGYHPDLDKLGHLYGPGSTAWRWQLRLLDHLVGMMVEQLPSGTLLTITGDHGMIEVSRKHDADDDERLTDGVALLGGDPRARHVYARPGAEADVLATWRTVLGDDATVVSGDDAAERGWFGPVDPRMRDRVGDVVAAMHGGAVVVRPEAEPFLSTLPGQHGSLTSAEQLVPLLVGSG
jgi:hypothetical protein